jgi:hypothetical protein
MTDCPRHVRHWQDDEGLALWHKEAGKAGGGAALGGGAQTATIDDILSAIDADQAAALDRLFALLSIRFLQVSNPGRGCFVTRSYLASASFWR